MQVHYSINVSAWVDWFEYSNVFVQLFTLKLYKRHITKFIVNIYYIPNRNVSTCCNEHSKNKKNYKWQCVYSYVHTNATMKVRQQGAQQRVVIVFN